MKREIGQNIQQEAKRLNHPEVGLVNSSTNPDQTPAKKTYTHDPHLHWAGKAEHTSFDVGTVSLHEHERIDPRFSMQATNPETGEVHAGEPGNIAMWMLDTDYNGRSVYPKQVFFPMAGKDEGWAKLAKSLKAELDEDLIQAYRGTVSLPFQPGPNQTIAVKIIDDRGIESLRVMDTQ